MTFRAERVWQGGAGCDALDDDGRESCEERPAGWITGDTKAEIVQWLRDAGWRVDASGYALCPEHLDGYVPPRMADCPLCGATVRECRLDDHTRTQHRTSPAAARHLANGAAPVPCPHCPFVTYNAKALGAHVRGAHPNVVALC